ncbi:sulfotransferase [Neolewinella antarctica]|uniref:Sulfotransferase family protein n=1 Tax=Neolewinella antarctica TaxID=442734 RepID=A0ABX0XAN4_9BACT|nr:sulfotransferase [Neolewinella antarctica]NJC26120.1 hypothetical protein [Neolewinella antarctica]
MEFKSYSHILRNKVLFDWAPFLRPIAYSAYAINSSPVIVLGNQKAGTSAIAALLAKATGGSYDIDLAGFRNPEYAALHAGAIDIKKVVQERALIEFSKDIVKEPGLTFLYPQLKEAFPQARFVFIVRDPRANIRSTLNRLNIPGSKTAIDPIEYPQISPIWKSILMNEWGRGTPGGSHIVRSAERWQQAVDLCADDDSRMHLIRYEDFNRGKVDAIEELAERLGRPVMSDITPFVDVQFQPKGKKVNSYTNFFGEENLRWIENICNRGMKKFNYTPEL